MLNTCTIWPFLDIRDLSKISSRDFIAILNHLFLTLFSTIVTPYAIMEQLCILWLCGIIHPNSHIILSNMDVTQTLDDYSMSPGRHAILNSFYASPFRIGCTIDDLIGKPGWRRDIDDFKDVCLYLDQFQYQYQYQEC